MLIDVCSTSNLRHSFLTALYNKQILITTVDFCSKFAKKGIERKKNISYHAAAL